MKLLHLVNLNSTNIGNGALIYGLERVLNEDFQGKLEFKRLAWDDYTFCFKSFDEKFVELINSYDGLIVGAAVSFNGRAYLKNTGFRFNLPLDLWEKIKKPIVFYGISNMVWPHQRYYNLGQLKKTMNYILNNPNIIFSVRKDGTKEWLEKLVGFKSDKIFTVPDTGVYVPTKDHDHPEIVEGKKNIIISLNGEDEEYRFGGRKREIFWQFFSKIMSEATIRNIWKKIPGWDSSKHKALKRLALAIEKISQDGKINVILAPHYFDDYKMISEMIPYFSSSFPHRNIISAGMLRVDKTEYFYNLYAKADLALSMRIHSMSPSIGIGTPMIALTTQTRMTAFMENAGLSDFALDMFDPKLTDKLCDLINYCLNNKDEVADKFSSSIGKMREKTREFNKRIESFLNERII